MAFAVYWSILPRQHVILFLFILLQNTMYVIYYTVL